jgi:cytochrome P450
MPVRPGSDARATHARTARPPRIRTRFAGLFTARRVEGFRPLVQRRPDELLQALGNRPTLDLIAEYARPLPFSVICDVMGVPPERRLWLTSATTVLRQAFANQRDPAFVEKGNAAVAELVDYFSRLLEERRESGADDLLPVLARDDFQDDDEGRRGGQLRILHSRRP